MQLGSSPVLVEWASRPPEWLDPIALALQEAASEVQGPGFLPEVANAVVLKVSFEPRLCSTADFASMTNRRTQMKGRSSHSRPTRGRFSVKSSFDEVEELKLISECMVKSIGQRMVLDTALVDWMHERRLVRWCLMVLTFTWVVAWFFCARSAIRRCSRPLLAS